jgi:hypothetical protein
MALAALETGKRRPEQVISDPGYFWFGNHKFRDDKEGGHGSVDMYKSIVQSCDTYYYMLANDMGVDLIHEQLSHFGFGEITGIDIQGESRGLLPSTEWKRRAYKRPEQQKWYAGETISLGIGQGYNNFTVLQIATATATVANPQGARMKPHMVREVEDVVSKETRKIAPQQVGQLTAKPENLADHPQGAVGVNLEGTSAAAFVAPATRAAARPARRRSITIAQNAKYKASQMEDVTATTRCSWPTHRGRPEDRHRDGGGERGLRRRQCRADRAPRVRLLPAGPVPERGRHRAGAPGQGHHPGGQAAPGGRVRLAAHQHARGTLPRRPRPGTAISPAAAVVQAQTVAAAFSPLGTATTGTPTAGTTFVPRWREPAPLAATAPQARSSAARATPSAR